MAKLPGLMDILVRPRPSSCFRALWGCCSSHGDHWGSAVAQAHLAVRDFLPHPHLAYELEAGLSLSYCCLQGQCGESS